MGGDHVDLPSQFGKQPFVEQVQRRRRQRQDGKRTVVLAANHSKITHAR
jgi:hypothetical protein